MLSKRIWLVLIGLLLLCAAVSGTVNVLSHDYRQLWSAGIMAFFALFWLIQKPWEKRRRAR